MDGSGPSGGKVFGRFTEPTHQVLGLARAEAAWPGPRWLAWSIGAYVPAPRPRDSELLGSLGIDLDTVPAALTPGLDQPGHLGHPAQLAPGLGPGRPSSLSTSHR
jgi:hypothetical protein